MYTSKEIKDLIGRNPSGWKVATMDSWGTSTVQIVGIPPKEYINHPADTGVVITLVGLTLFEAYLRTKTLGEAIRLLVDKDECAIYQVLDKEPKRYSYIEGGRTIIDLVYGIKIDTPINKTVVVDKEDVDLILKEEGGQDILAKIWIPDGILRTVLCELTSPLGKTLGYCMGMLATLEKGSLQEMLQGTESPLFW